MKGENLKSIFFSLLSVQTLLSKGITLFSSPQKPSVALSAAAAFIPRKADTALRCYFSWSNVTKASDALSVNIQPLITEKQEVWMTDSGKNLLPSGSSSGLAFDRPPSHTRTLSGCGSCLALWQVEWVHGELFIFPNKSNEVLVSRHHADLTVLPISPKQVCLTWLKELSVVIRHKGSPKLWPAFTDVTVVLEIEATDVSTHSPRMLWKIHPVLVVFSLFPLAETLTSCLENNSFLIGLPASFLAPYHLSSFYLLPWQLFLIHKIWVWPPAPFPLFKYLQQLLTTYRRKYTVLSKHTRLTVTEGVETGGIYTWNSFLLF